MAEIGEVMRAAITKFSSRLGYFRRDSQGTFAVVLALSTLPMILMLGLGIDYFRALSLKARLDEASDAASIAAVNAAANYMKNNAVSTDASAVLDEAIGAGEAQGASVFAANMGVAADELAPKSLQSQTKVTSVEGNGFSATTTYSAGMQTAFFQLVNIPQLPVDGSASAQVTPQVYLDLHFLIDGSASMGIGATSSDQNAMQNKVGCTIACHMASNDNYAGVRAINPPVQLRIDVIAQAIAATLQNIKKTEFSQQVQVSIDEFSGHVVNIFGPSTDMDAAIAAASKIDLLNSVGNGGTYSSYSLQQYSEILPRPGDGSSSQSRLGYVLLFTDGVQDSYQLGPNNALIDGSGTPPANYYISAPNVWGTEGNLEVFDSSYCDNIKSLKYHMMTLDFQYIVTPAEEAEDGRYQTIQNVINPSIQANMQACASSSNMATVATTPAQFQAALAALMSNVNVGTHLTQ